MVIAITKNSLFLVVAITKMHISLGVTEGELSENYSSSFSKRFTTPLVFHRPVK